MEQISYNLRPKQREFVESTDKFSFYVGGIGAGKTYAGAVKSILYMLNYPGSLGMVIAPTYTMLKDSSRRTWLSLLPRRVIRNENRNENSVVLTNGSEVLFRSADSPDRLRGPSLAWVWMDEAPLCGHYTWQVLKGRLRQSGFTPQAWCTGTPHGRDGFWAEFEGPDAQGSPGHALFRASTYDNLPNLPPDYVDNIGYSGSFYDQEILGRFEAFEGLVYTLESTGPGAHVIPRLPDHTVFTRCIGGIDWGYTNPTALTVFGLTSGGQVYQLDEWYVKKALVQESVCPAVAQFTRKHQVDTWYVDPSQPGHIATLKNYLDTAECDTSIKPGDNAILPGIQTVSHLLAPNPLSGVPKLRILKHCIHTLKEYACYCYDSDIDVQEGDTQREPPQRQLDHAMDSTRYALHTALGRGRGSIAAAGTRSLTHGLVEPGFETVGRAGPNDLADADALADRVARMRRVMRNLPKRDQW